MNDLDKVLEFVKSEQNKVKKGLKMWGWIGEGTRSFYRGSKCFLENIEDFIETEKIKKRSINKKINLGTIIDLDAYKYTIENFNVDLKKNQIELTIRSLNQERKYFTYDLMQAKKEGIIDITFLNKILK